MRESGPPGADHTVLLLPGALCTAPFYDDLLADPKLSGKSIRFVATTLPGFGDTPPPDDLSVENYARLAGKLAADFAEHGPAPARRRATPARRRSGTSAPHQLQPTGKR